MKILVLQKFIFFCAINVIILVLLLDHDFKYNERLGKISVFICCQLYNFFIGFLSYVMFITSVFLSLALFKNINPYIFAIILLLLAISLFLIPANYFANKKIKMNSFLYTIIVIAVVTLGVIMFLLNQNNLN